MSDPTGASFDHALGQALAALARSGSLITYGALAADLGLNGPGRITKLTQALEKTMEEDASAGQPLRAASVVSRGGDGLPARGFFDKAQALGLFDPDCALADARLFHQSQLLALRQAMR